jgi:hypothetical protein
MAQGCQGVRLQDGTTYDCRPGGTIEVERPDHVAAIQMSPNARQEHLGNGTPRAALGAGLPDNRCPACKHNNFPWASTCAHCDTALA